MGRGKNKPKEIIQPESPGQLLETAYKSVSMYREENERLKAKINQLEKQLKNEQPPTPSPIH